MSYWQVVPIRLISGQAALARQLPPPTRPGPLSDESPTDPLRRPGQPVRSGQAQCFRVILSHRDARRQRRGPGHCERAIIIMMMTYKGARAPQGHVVKHAASFAPVTAVVG